MLTTFVHSFKLVNLPYLLTSINQQLFIYKHPIQEHISLIFHQFSLLHLAAEGGHVKIVKFLINKGAVINAKENAGVSM